MNPSSISSQQYSHTWIGEVTFPKLLVSWLDGIFIQYDAQSIRPFSTHISIHFQIVYMTLESDLNNIFVSAEVM